MTKTEEIMERVWLYVEAVRYDHLSGEGSQDYYESTLRAAIEELVAENEALKHDNHNLNWALGTEAYTEMYTADEREAQIASVHAMNAWTAMMAENKLRHDQMVKDAARYRWLRLHNDTPYYAGVYDAHVDAAIEETP